MNPKGSVLVFSLIVLSLLLISALSVATVSVTDKKSVISSEKSNIAFQVADSGVERILQKIYKESPSTLNDLGPCSGGVVTGSTASGTYKISFYDNSLIPGQLTDCGDSNWRNKAVRLKSNGVFNNTARAVEVAINAPDVVAFWKFNDGSGTTAADASGNSKTGTLVNGPSWTSDNKANANKALSFSGTNQYVTSSDTTGFDDLFSAGISMVAWVNYPDASSLQRTITIESNDNANYNYWLQLSGGKIQFGTVASGGYKTGVTTLSSNTWYHVAVVTDYTNGGTKIYINGSDDGGSVTGTLANTSDNGSLDVGRLMSGGSASYGKGIFDDVRIYSRALSASEVQTIYNTTK